MPLLWLLAAVQLVLAVRVFARMARSARGIPLDPARGAGAPGSIAVVVPVLDEAQRLGPCLDRLIQAGAEVGEIIVVDGGSTDGTMALARSYAARDPRVRLVDAAPVPAGWNGKAWGLDAGLRAASPGAAWIATIDADVRPDPGLPATMAAHALAHGVPALSIATSQSLADAGSGIAHPAMLTTLVYRYGLPGNAATRVADVQANGQCFLARRDLLLALDVFRRARASVCEDVSVARLIVQAGHPVGFYEAGERVVVRMHDDWRDVWRNWPRSLTLRDGVAPGLAALGLAEVVFVQALPPLLLVAAWLFGAGQPGAGALLRFEAALVLIRLAVLAGTARAYRNPPWTYWLSPCADLAVAAALIASALRRRHTWRGRTLVNSERTT